MRRRIMFWGIVCCGLVGAMLVAGTAGAERDQDRDDDHDTRRGGLPACQAKLNTCNASLTTCQADLAACQAEPTVIFPGDGVDGPALSYTDNSDGTFTDNNTLLMWEKKDTAGGIHDVNNMYTWSSTGTAADGTAFTVFLATLNNKCDGNETTACTSNADCTGIGNGLCGHAGHRDWRMPNVKELQSIVDYGRTIPASSVPGSTAADNYWSSTTNAGGSSLAWVVNFNDGFVGNDDKFNSTRSASAPCEGAGDRSFDPLSHLILCVL